MTTLLARIRLPDPRVAGARADEALRASVLEHLRNICRTRRGSMLTCPDYGIPDVGEMVHSFPHAAVEIRDALQHTIDAYEPRLANVRVKHVPSATLDVIIRFDITATFAGAGRGAPVRFETRLDASRSITVS